MLNQELYPLDLYNVTFYTTNISVCNKDLHLWLYFFVGQVKVKPLPQAGCGGEMGCQLCPWPRKGYFDPKFDQYSQSFIYFMEVRLFQAWNEETLDVLGCKMAPCVQCRPQCIVWTIVYSVDHGVQCEPWWCSLQTIVYSMEV